MKAKNETTEVKNNYDTIAEWMADNGCSWEDMDKDLSIEYKRDKKLEKLGI